MTDPSVIAALRAALASDPLNGALWVHLGDVLDEAQQPDDAAEAYRNASEIESSSDAALRKLLPLLRRLGRLDEALIRAEKRLAQGDDPDLRQELERIQAARGKPGQIDADETSTSSGQSRKALAKVNESSDPEDWASQFDWGDLRVTFDDVAGLEDVKRQIRLRIIAPFQQPEIYEAFGRDAGGGLLLYGPPGCGKTFIARATAGELNANFVSVSLHEIVDQFWGVSEKLIHALFDKARRSKPTVIFFDEFDALGASRGGHSSAFWSTLVNQLLQEMDGMAGRNTEILVFAATNMPWKVDAAFRRPGRFDRVLLVTPPDRKAREAILERHVRNLPGGKAIQTGKLAKATSLFSGADLRALCERAAEGALERSLETGNVHTVSMGDFDQAVTETESTTHEWLATARNYARYSNEGQYDDLVKFLKKAKKW